MRTWLLFDVNNLAYRAFYTTGSLNYNGVPTGTTYGVLGTILQVQGAFQSERCAFAFDYGRNKRYKIEKTYKLKRRQAKKERTPREIRLFRELQEQINLLRTDYLERMGYGNIFYQRGYEADDVIASVCCNLPDNDKAIIISSDQDLFQLLSKRVSIFDPKKKQLRTKKDFKKEFGIRPKQWVQVKALSGCNSDEILGIKGVGEKTAIRFLTGELTKGKKFDSIISEEGQKIKRRNLPLVKLPLEGCKEFKLKEDGKLNWKPVLNELKITTLHPDPEYREKK